MNTSNRVNKLAKMGMLTAISLVLMVLINFPIIPATPFLIYDPADIPILIGSFVFGPLAGMVITVIVALIQAFGTANGGGLYGAIMGSLATGAFVVTAGLIYRRTKTRKNAIIGLICGILAATIIMIPANLIITPLFLGMPRSAVYPLLPWITLFNLIKAGINAVLTLAIYKRISRFLQVKEDGSNNTNEGK